MADPQDKEMGFTLVEVAVAFAVLALAAGTLMSIFASGPAKTLFASHKYMSLLAAKSTLARVGNDQPLVPGEYHGTADGNVRWTLSIQPFAEEKGGATPMVTKPYLVTVRAAAGPVSRPAETVLTTVRLGLTAP